MVEKGGGYTVSYSERFCRLLFLPNLVITILAQSETFWETLTAELGIMVHLQFMTFYKWSRSTHAVYNTPWTFKFVEFYA